MFAQVERETKRKYHGDVVIRMPIHVETEVKEEKREGTEEGKEEKVENKEEKGENKEEANDDDDDETVILNKINVIDEQLIQPLNEWSLICSKGIDRPENQPKRMALFNILDAILQKKWR